MEYNTNMFIRTQNLTKPQLTTHILKIGIFKLQQQWVRELLAKLYNPKLQTRNETALIDAKNWIKLMIEIGIKIESC